MLFSVRTGSLRVPTLLLVLFCSQWLQAAAGDARLGEILGFESVGDRGSEWRLSGGVSKIDSTFRRTGNSSALLERVSAAGRSVAGASIEFMIPLSGAAAKATFWLKPASDSATVTVWVSTNGVDRALDVGSEDYIFGPGAPSEWKPISVNIPIDSDARSIALGIRLTEGRIYLDDVDVQIDGRSIGDLLYRPPPTAPTSGITITHFTDLQIRNLIALCKIWSFIRYYATGPSQESDFDQELIKLIRSCLGATTENEANALMESWARSLPAYSSQSGPPQLALQEKSRVAWICDEQVLGSGLSKILTHLYYSRGKHGSFFSKPFDRVFSTAAQPALPLFQVPDSGYQIAVLFKIWSCIYFNSPLQGIENDNMSAILASAIPRFASASSDLRLYTESVALVKLIDPSARWISIVDSKEAVAREARLPAHAVVSGDAICILSTDVSAVKPSHLAIGDVLISVDNLKVTNRLISLRKRYLTEPALAEQRIVEELLNGPRGAAIVRVLRGSQVLAFEETRTSTGAILSRGEVGSHEQSFRMLPSGIVCLNLAEVTGEEVRDLITSARLQRGLIIDARCGARNFVGDILLSSLPLSDRHVVRKRLVAINDSLPGETLEIANELSVASSSMLKPPVAVLIDSRTSANALFTADALTGIPGVKFVGTETASVDSLFSYHRIYFGLSIQIRSLRVEKFDKIWQPYYSLKPDITAQITPQGIIHGHDEVMEAAEKDILRN